MCGCMCICTCFFVHVKARGQPQVSSLRAAHLVFFLTQDFSVRPGAGWPGSPRCPLVYTSPVLGNIYHYMPLGPAFYVGIGDWTCTGLYNKYWNLRESFPFSLKFQTLRTVFRRLFLVFWLFSFCVSVHFCCCNQTLLVIWLKVYRNFWCISGGWNAKIRMLVTGQGFPGLCLVPPCCFLLCWRQEPLPIEGPSIHSGCCPHTSFLPCDLTS